MTDSNYKRSISSQSTNLNNSSYINGFSFKVDATSTEKVKFYKKDITKDYTYPIINDNSIVKVSVKTVD